jgi:two-component system, sensor histidine kinase LadS
LKNPNLNFCGSSFLRGKRFNYILPFLLIFTAFPVKGVDTLVLSSSNKFYHQYQITDEYLEVLIDSNTEWEINEVTTDILQSKFIPMSPSVVRKKERGAFWVKLTIQNNSEKDYDWTLLQGDPHVGRFEVYEKKESGNYELINKGGADIPFQERKYKSNSIGTDLNLKTGDVKTYYLRYVSNIDFSIKLLVQDNTFYTEYVLSEYFVLGLYYGILLIMAIYNLFIFFSVRQNIYIYYTIYVLATILFNTSNDLFAFQFLWPNSPSINYLIYYYGRLILVLSMVGYAWAFLHWGKSKKELQLLKVLTALFVIQFLIEFYILETEFFHYTLLLPLLVILVTAIKNLKEGYTPAKFFVVGFGCVLAGLILFIAMERRLIQASVYTVYGYNIGLLVEIVVLSRALGERFRFLKKSKEESDRKIIDQLRENEILKDKVNRELEEKVAERTKELVEASKKLEIANEEINHMNEFLKQENMELQYDKKELARARIMLSGVNFKEFSNIYPDDDSCHKFLAGLKWRMEYKCKKCKNNKYSEGKIKHSRRCTKCNYDESPTLGTIFSRVKFPIVKAFYMVFLYYSSKEKLSSTDMSRILKLRQKTSWSFIQKIKAYSEKKKNKLKIENLENWTELILD